MKVRMMFVSVTLAFTLTVMVPCCFCLAVPVSESFDFAEGRWDRSRWLSPRNPDWDRGTPMVQEKDGLVNWSDPAWTDEEIFKKHQIDTFSALVLTNVYSGKVTCTTETSFDHRMAPSLVLVKEMTKDAQGRDQLIDFYEIVLYDGGLNIWHHKPHPGDGVQHIPIDKVAWLVTRFEPKTRYDLSMTVERKMHRGRPTGQMTVRCGGHEVGFSDALLPEKFHVGILGSEGRCRFYSFKVMSGN